MAITDEQMKDYLGDHLPYERMMLKYTFRKMTTLVIKSAWDVCDWNAYYESFAVHARNLYWFLTNEDKNMTALVFVAHFSAPKSPDTVRIFQHMPGQVMHLSPRRPGEDARKMQASDAAKFCSWFDKYFTDFISRLPDHHQANWRGDLSEPPSDNFVVEIAPASVTTNYTISTPATPSQSSHPTQVGSSSLWQAGPQKDKS